ncbi:unnamed protein product [Soboliphyme baturini]|uniref:Protein phosphatase 1 regulatory subunit 1B n=1 Tax=Soboliphyme baturini TaxID=241478 RepID=A0A183IX84_9BILA|nr:unnamed protein product [Soboliphyme baturini]
MDSLPAADVEQGKKNCIEVCGQGKTTSADQVPRPGIAKCPFDEVALLHHGVLSSEGHHITEKKKVKTREEAAAEPLEESNQRMFGRRVQVVLKPEIIKLRSSEEELGGDESKATTSFDAEEGRSKPASCPSDDQVSTESFWR